MKHTGGQQRQTLWQAEDRTLLDAGPDDDRQVEQNRADGIEPDEMPGAGGFFGKQIPRSVRRRGKQDRDQCAGGNWLGPPPAVFQGYKVSFEEAHLLRAVQQLSIER